MIGYSRKTLKPITQGLQNSRPLSKCWRSRFERPRRGFAAGVRGQGPGVRAGIAAGWSDGPAWTPPLTPDPWPLAPGLTSRDFVLIIAPAAFGHAGQLGVELALNAAPHVAQRLLRGRFVQPDPIERGVHLIIVFPPDADARRVPGVLAPGELREEFDEGVGVLRPELGTDLRQRGVLPLAQAEQLHPR